MKNADEVWKDLPEVTEVYQRAQSLHTQARDLESSVLNVAITIEEVRYSTGDKLSLRPSLLVSSFLAMLGHRGGSENVRTTERYSYSHFAIVSHARSKQCKTTQTSQSTSL